MTAKEVIKLLELRPLTVEGGFFREIYRSAQPAAGTTAPRCCGTSIYYLLEDEQVSQWHQVASDEIWIHNQGAPARQLLLFPDGSWEERLIGSDLAAGQRPQSLIPANTWQAATLLPSPPCDWGLFSCVVVPGFEYADFKSSTAIDLARQWPSAATIILSRYHFG